MGNERKSAIKGDPDKNSQDLSKINTTKESCSTYPLLKYWDLNCNNATISEMRLTDLLSKLELSKPKNIQVCFEYPVKPTDGKGKASMTDIMIVSDTFKIAIEGKYTEPTYQSVTSWLKKDQSNVGNREKVLNSWIKMLNPFCLEELDIEKIEHIEYQLVHRTASACNANINKAFIVFQQFCDDNNNRSAAVKKKIGEFIKIIKPKETLKFFIDSIEWNPHSKQCSESVFEEIKC